jgi:hypothetical protein
MIQWYHRWRYSRARRVSQETREAVQHFRTIAALPEAPEMERLRQLYRTRPLPR